MKELIVKIATPDGEVFSGEAKSVTVKTINGDVQIMRGHADLLSPIGVGKAKLVGIDGKEREASISGGFILVNNAEVSIVATTFEFADEIDIERAKKARENAERAVAAASEAKDIEIAKAKLARAVSRINVASGN